MAFQHLHFQSSSAPLARQACKELQEKYHQTPINDADVIVALGGDGYMLECMQESLSHYKPIFGMNRGTVGFMMNPFRVEDLPGRLDRACEFDFHPLQMEVTFKDNTTDTLMAFNECTLRRMHCQTAHIRIQSFLDNKEKVVADEMIGDGIIVSTPLGSTGYYKAAGGRPFPWTSHKMGLKSVCAQSNIYSQISNKSEIVLDVLDSEKRPAIVSADNQELVEAVRCQVVTNQNIKSTVLFDKSVLMKKLFLQHIR